MRYCDRSEDTLVSLPVFIGKYHCSKDFRNYKCLQLWTGRREDFASLSLMVSPYFIPVMQNKIVPLLTKQLLGETT